MKSLLVSLTLFWGLSSDLFSQKLKWGKIPEEDLKMTVYPLDSLAAAVVLDELGELTIRLKEGKRQFKLDVHVRTKVLSSAGFRVGDIKIPFFSKHDFEEMGDLDLQVFSPTGEKIKVKDKYIFEEKLDENISQVRFAVPRLEAGSIFEYRYSLYSEQIWSPRPWVFQKDIPVRRSQYVVNVPATYNYGYIVRGARFVRREGDPEGLVYTRLYPTPKTDIRYIGENLPAFAPEPYMTAPQNHLASVQMQLDRVSMLGIIGWQSFFPTWISLNNMFLRDRNFGEQIKNKEKHDRIWAALQPELDSISDPYEKLDKAYTFLNSKLKWNDVYSVYAYRDLDDIFEKGTGNSAELNLILVACLRRAGFEANPMLIGTRSHGAVSTQYPILEQFDHVLAHITIDSVAVLMDLGNKHRPFSVVRGEAINGGGFLIREKDPAWADVSIPTDLESTFVNLQVGDDGTLSGNVVKSYSGYAAVGLLTKIEDEPSLKSIHEMLTEQYPEIRLDSLRCGPNPNQPGAVLERFNFEILNGAQVADDMVYLNPPLLTIFSENPFKSEKRVYPVEFLNPRKFNSTLNLKVPAGMQVAEIPEDVSLSLPNDGGRFRMVVSNREGMVQVSLRVNLNQLRFEPEEYAGLRHFYDLVIEKQSERIVLKRG